MWIVNFAVLWWLILWFTEFKGSSRKGAKFSEQKLDRLKGKKPASLFPEEDWEDVIFIEYVSKTGCSPNPDPHLLLSHLLRLG
jgi:hypothetical protein